jgi:cell division protein FtsQ
MSQAARNIKPKSAEKRTASGQNNGRRLAGLLFLLLVIGSIVWGGVQVVSWMNDASRLPLSRLVVTGDKQFTTTDDVRQAILSLGPPGTFMSQDVDVIQQQIEHFPWIKQVSVRKQWPDELKIHLVEYVPEAQWNDQHVVDSDGNSFMLPVNQRDLQKGPKLYGPEGSEKEVMSGFYQMENMLKPLHLRVVAASMTARKAWQLVTDNGIRIVLGRNDNRQRLQRFIQLYPDWVHTGANEHKTISYVDLRYDAGAAVTWVPAQAEIQPANQLEQKNQVQANP